MVMLMLLFGWAASSRSRDNIARVLAMTVQTIHADSDQDIRVFGAASGMADRDRPASRPGVVAIGGVVSVGVAVMVGVVEIVGVVRAVTARQPPSGAEIRSPW